MNTIFNQKGASIIAIIAIMLILAVMGVALVSLVTTGSDISVNQLQSEQALYVAEAGMEKAVFELKNGTACNALLSGSIGAGAFTITGTPSTNSIALFANITAADTVIPVNSTAGFASHGRIRIENEDINYASLSTSCAPFAPPACFTGAQRGVAGSVAAAHNTGAGVNTAQDECFIKSTGTISTNAQRMVERAVQNPGAMMVYSKENPAADRDVPFFMRWDGTNWGPERQATSVGGNQRIYHMVLKFARTRNEAILGTLQQNGEIEVQVWNGNTQTWSTPTLLAYVGAASDVAFRSFDIEYETSGDRAIVVYKDANGSADPDYRIWDGISWSFPATNIDIPTTGEVRWIELAPHPTSSEIAMITLDANNDVKGMLWPGDGAAGTAWDEMGAVGVIWDTAAADSGNPAMSPSKVIDVAYEQLSGRAMFIWGNDNNDIGDGDGNNNDEQRYMIWNGVALSAGVLTIPAMNNVADWVRLVPQPNSNELMYGVQDGARDLNTRRWSGPPAADPSWDTAVQHPEHDASTEDVDNRNFDIVFETNPAFTGRAWLVWGNAANVSRKQWDGAAWGGTTNFGDDAALVQLMAHPKTGTIFTGIYQSTDSAAFDITALQNVGGVWSAETQIWNGGITSNLYERVFIAAERYVPIINWREIYP